MRLVDVGDVPGAGLDPDGVDDAARGLRTDAGIVRDGGHDVADAWAGLSASYQAPEAPQLLRVMDPVRADTDRLADELERVASALARFAAELREIVARCDRLRAEVAEFRARVAAAPVGGANLEPDRGPASGGVSDVGEPSGLDMDPVLASQNGLLLSLIATVTEELVEAERTCAAAVRAIDGPPLAGGGFGGFVAGAVGVASSAVRAANPWGESTQPESCVGDAVAQAGMAVWNGGNWAGFASAYTELAGLPGIGRMVSGWNESWTEAGRSLIGGQVSVAEGFVVGLGEDVDDIVSWGAGQVDELWQAGEHVAGWTGDWIDEGQQRVSDWWGSKFGAAIRDDWSNVGDSLLQLNDATFGAMLEGDVPRVTEIVASSIMSYGAVIGATGTTLNGGVYELNVFDDGELVPGTAHDAGEDGHPEPVVPTGIPALLQSVTSAYEAGEVSGGREGYIRITTIDALDPDDPPKVIVSIPGTQAWSPLAGGVAADLTGNLVTAGGGRSTMAEAVRNVIVNENNVPPDAEILLVGHSQGGMAAADLASDPEFLKERKIADVVTFGSPVDSNRINPAINTLELQHATDIVPRLDFEDASILDVLNPFSGVLNNGIDTAVGWITGDERDSNHAVVTMPNAGSPFNLGANHDHQDYRKSVEEIIDPEAAEGRDGQVLADYEGSIASRGFLTNDQSRIRVRDVQVSREG